MRGLGIVDPELAGNMLLWAISEPPEISLDASTREVVVSLAKSIRTSLLRMREPDYAHSCAKKVGQLMFSATTDVMSYNFIPLPGCMTTNITWKCVHLVQLKEYILTFMRTRFDWTSAHFGYPGQTRFYHHNYRKFSRYAKMFTPNPELLPDGRTWRERSGDAEIGFCMAPEAKDSFQRMLQQNAESFGMSGKIEFVE